MKDFSPVDRIVSKALDTDVGRQFLNEFKSVLHKFLVFGSVALTIYLIFKINSWLSIEE